MLAKQKAEPAELRASWHDGAVIETLRRLTDAARAPAASSADGRVPVQLADSSS